MRRNKAARNVEMSNVIHIDAHLLYGLCQKSNRCDRKRPPTGDQFLPSLRGKMLHEFINIRKEAVSRIRSGEPNPNFIIRIQVMFFLVQLCIETKRPCKVLNALCDVLLPSRIDTDISGILVVDIARTHLDLILHDPAKEPEPKFNRLVQVCHHQPSYRLGFKRFQCCRCCFRKYTQIRTGSLMFRCNRKRNTIPVMNRIVLADVLEDVCHLPYRECGLRSVVHIHEPQMLCVAIRIAPVFKRHPVDGPFSLRVNAQDLDRNTLDIVDVISYPKIAHCTETLRGRDLGGNRLCFATASATSNPQDLFGILPARPPAVKEFLHIPLSRREILAMNFLIPRNQHRTRTLLVLTFGRIGFVLFLVFTHSSDILIKPKEVHLPWVPVRAIGSPVPNALL